MHITNGSFLSESCSKPNMAQNWAFVLLKTGKPSIFTCKSRSWCSLSLQSLLKIDVKCDSIPKW